MLNFHLQKRHVCVPGMVLLALFCFFGMGLIAYSSVCINSAKLSANLLAAHISFIILLLVSLVAPVASFIKPGFAYKGHPGMRHLSTLVSGSLILFTSLVSILYAFMYLEPLCMQEYYILGPAYSLYGLIAIIQYWSFFKGPTSRYGRVFQPYLPTLE